MNILITGGASGLGEAITKKLASNKEDTVYFTFCNSKKNASEIESEFSNAKGIKCDFKKPDEVNLLVDKINGFDLDALINNAYNGNISPTHFHKIPTDLFVNDFLENVIPTIQISQEAIKNFRKKKQGKIITILTSYLTNVPPAGLAVYVANKAYLAKLSQVWATENVKFNIVSNSVSPSFMQTGMAAETDERVIEQIISEHPLKKLLTVQEVAETVEFLIKDSGQINGADIVMNAGVNLK
jgi:3-oxoacyl-[acyl-carrier protein] reductase